MKTAAAGQARCSRPNGLPRAVEFVVVFLMLIVLAPVMALFALAVWLSSPGPILFRQTRVGRGGHAFTMFKFRTMRADSAGIGVTMEGDPRITSVGRALRKSKLDELPELWNVLRGDMAIVGPRPEVPRYVDANDPRWREVLQARPGLTDPVTVSLRHEERLLASAGADRERFYIQSLLPWKLEGNARYLRTRTAWSDIAVVFATAAAVFRPATGNGCDGAPSVQPPPFPD